MGKRDEARAATTAKILTAARTEIAQEGGGGLSMRAVAREVGMVSSAVYRYFPTREALLTAMIVESYERLALSLTQIDDESAPPPARWRALGAGFRSWARERPHEFQLIYGTPIPGYVAPPETVPAAAAVAAPFVAVGGGGVVKGFDGVELRDQLASLATDFGVHSPQLGAVLAELAALVGFVSLELAGHFTGSADPADHLFDALLDRQATTLGLA